MSTPEDPLTPEQKFEALKLRYEKDVELLQFMSNLDFQIFGGYITLQLLLGSWLVEHTPGHIAAKLGVAVMDLTLAVVAATLLHYDMRRRSEVVATLKNITTAFQFDRPGAYLPDVPLSAPTVFRPWRNLYMVGISVTAIGLLLIVFFGDSKP